MIKNKFSVAATAPNRGASTAAVLFGIALTVLVLPSDHVEGVFATAAVGLGLSLCIATGMEAMGGVRNLIRVDIIILWVLYGLTFLEFLFPQPDVDTRVSVAAATMGSYAALLGFAGLIVGRHLIPMRSSSARGVAAAIRPASVFFLFVFVTLLGYLHVFAAVNFDPFEVLRQMSLPRFTQAWGRGRYGGDLYSYLAEMGALIYLIPPIAGLVYARAKNYSIVQKAVITVVLIFTFYYGFASGTRNIITVYVTTFLGAYFLNKPKVTLSQILYVGLPTFVLLLLGTAYMLEFRNVGLRNFSFSENTPKTLYIDHNMVITAKITDLFPEPYEYLGFEVPYNGLIRPVPRLLWPGKPEGLSVSIESVAGVTDSTTSVASTFIGEAYMSGGLIAVLFFSLLFGAAAEMWNSVSRNITSPFAQLLYASGLFCAAMTMRSMLWTTTTMLPTLALYLYGRFLLPHSYSRRSVTAINQKKSRV